MVRLDFTFELPSSGSFPYCEIQSTSMSFSLIYEYNLAGKSWPLKALVCAINKSVFYFSSQFSYNAGV